MEIKTGYPKLPPDFKEKWVSALRSGEYKKGIRHLYDPATDSYCCLGVACRVAGYETTVIAGRGLINNLPKVPKELDSYLTRYFHFSTHLDHLVKMNDGENKSFAEIADWIEENL